MANAIEAIYRDLEYARSLIKRVQDGADPKDDHHEASPIPNRKRVSMTVPQSPPHSSMTSSCGSGSGRGMSDEWSVISGEDNRGQASEEGGAETVSRATGRTAPTMTRDETLRPVKRPSTSASVGS